MFVLGISAFYHDSAAALIQDGKIIAAASEERFTRIKNDNSFPAQSIAYCLSEASITIDQLDHIVFFEDTHLKFDRISRTYIAYLPKSLLAFLRAMGSWLTAKLSLEEAIRKHLKFNGELLFTPHHISHAASAFYPSPLEEAAILCIDGVGEWTTTSIGKGEGSQIQMLKEITYPHSLGMLYSAFTQFAGFKVNADEYKLMGLAPYGRPIYKQKILDHLIDIKEDGSYKLNLKYFDYHHGLSTINKNFEKLFGFSRRVPETEIRAIDQDLAASIQSVFNDIIVKLATSAKQMTNSDNLVLAGGVALNCVANGFLASKKIFKKIWVQPAAGDAGGALGAALYAYFQILGNKRVTGVPDQGASHLGPEFSDKEIEHNLKLYGIQYSEFTDRKVLNEKIAEYLVDEKVIGLFQGRMEFGPRALGARSIIGDPRSEKMQRTMNLMIKYRENFRPFAPAVLKEHAHELFEMDYHSPYMQFVVPIRKDKQAKFKEAQSDGLQERLYQRRSDWPAITHVDYSARVQTVDPNENPLFYDVIDAFYQKTGCPSVINTSFNIRGEPIVCTPLDALRCFFSNEMDVLVLDQFIITKDKQNWGTIGKMYYEPEFFKVN